MNRKAIEEWVIEGTPYNIVNELSGLDVDYSEISSELDLDCLAIYNNDPAAESEVFVRDYYVTFAAIRAYRLAHRLWVAGYRSRARIISEVAHSLTDRGRHEKINTVCIRALYRRR